MFNIHLADCQLLNRLRRPTARDIISLGADICSLLAHSKGSAGAIEVRRGTIRNGHWLISLVISFFFFFFFSPFSFWSSFLFLLLLPSAVPSSTHLSHVCSYCSRCCSGCRHTMYYYNYVPASSSAWPTSSFACNSNTRSHNSDPSLLYCTGVYTDDRGKAKKSLSCSLWGRPGASVYTHRTSRPVVQSKKWEQAALALIQ